MKRVISIILVLAMLPIFCAFENFPKTALKEVEEALPPNLNDYDISTYYDEETNCLSIIAVTSIPLETYNNPSQKDLLHILNQSLTVDLIASSLYDDSVEALKGYPDVIVIVDCFSYCFDNDTLKYVDELELKWSYSNGMYLDDETIAKANEKLRQAEEDTAKSRDALLAPPDNGTGTMTTTGKCDRWYQIVVNGVTGDVVDDHVKNNNTTEEKEEEKNQADASGSNTSQPTPGNETVTINTSWANIRNGPGINYEIIAVAIVGDSFPVTGKCGSWYQISFKGDTAYVPATSCDKK